MLTQAFASSAFFLLPALASSVVALGGAAANKSTSLGELALQQILETASPIFGVYDYNATATNTSTWMKKYPDSTQLVHMNIPGTHDSSTWNYSQATQDSLLHITEVDGVTPSPAAIYRCQERSYFDMLNAGIRAFDIRYSFDATNSSLVVYHSAALQSETALLSDIMFGFYQWLDDHPSETLLLSFSKLVPSAKKYSADGVAHIHLIFQLTMFSSEGFIYVCIGHRSLFAPCSGTTFDWLRW
jgi:1-phosphatidylinositol phosphodiesterase